MDNNNLIWLALYLNLEVVLVKVFKAEKIFWNECIKQALLPQWTLHKTIPITNIQYCLLIMGSLVWSFGETIFLHDKMILDIESTDGQKWCGISTL